MQLSRIYVHPLSEFYNQFLFINTKTVIAIKKNRKTILTPKYENFDSKADKSLTEIYDRFQKLLNDLSLVEKKQKRRIKLPTFLTSFTPSKKQKRRIKSTPPKASIKFTQKPKPKTQTSKDDYIHICDIKEFSDIELYLDELEDVRRIAAYRQLPERLVFKYKGAGERTWPLHRILNEGYSTLIRVYSAIQKDSGFTRTARTEILNKIANIRKTWREPNALPRTLLIQERGITIHKSPHWLMEFRDNKGVRRFFRIEDQLKIASNETLKDMQSKLDINEEDEAEFYRQLQLQIEENDTRLGKKTRDQRKRKYFAQAKGAPLETIEEVSTDIEDLQRIRNKASTDVSNASTDNIHQRISASTDKASTARASTDKAING
ncbi:hypothetical protein AgCh_039955 [Apium graveolens]